MIKWHAGEKMKKRDIEEIDEGSRSGIGIRSFTFEYDNSRSDLF